MTFDLAGGTHLGGGALRQGLLPGDSAQAPVTGRMGFRFDGWDKDFSNVTSDLTVTALWEPIRYKIPVQEVTPGEAIVDLADMAAYNTTVHILYAVTMAGGDGSSNILQNLESSIGNEAFAEDLGVFSATAVPIALSMQSLGDHYPDMSAPIGEFGILFKELTGLDFSTYRFMFESSDSMSFDDGRAYWSYQGMSFESWSFDETTSGNDITMETSISVSSITGNASDAGEAIWRIKGTINPANKYAPYDLVSITYLGVDYDGDFVPD